MTNKYIILIGEMEFPSKNAAAQATLGIASLLNKIGFETILHGFNKNVHSSNILNLEQNINGHKIYESSYPSSVIDWGKFIVRCDYISSLIKLLGPQNIHAIITYNYPAIAMARMIRLCSKFGISFVSYCTEWYGPSNRPFPFNLVKNVDTFLRMRIINNYARNVICVSDYLEMFYMNNGCHTVNIPTLVDNCDTKWTNSMKYMPNKRRKLVIVGSFGETFGKDRLDWLLEVLQKVKDDNINFQLQIIGATMHDYLSVFPRHRMLIEGLKNEIVFLGRLAHEKAIEFIKKADYVVFFRNISRVTSAGFPTKLAESFACGTPVITNSTSSISKYIINGKNGYLAESNSFIDLYYTMRKALTDNDSKLQEMHSFCLTKNTLHIKNFIAHMQSFMENL